jgi:hypothetical protein
LSFQVANPANPANLASLGISKLRVFNASMSRALIQNLDISENECIAADEREDGLQSCLYELLAPNAGSPNQANGWLDWVTWV